MHFECDIDAYRDRRAQDDADEESRRRLTLHECRHRATLQTRHVQQLERRASELFPDSFWNQQAWVQARLRLRLIGCTGPRVRIGCARHITGDLA